MRNSSKALLYGLLLKVSGFLKISFLIGSQMIWFSASNSIIPLAGAFGGIMGAALLFLVRQVIHLFFFKTISLSFLAFCIPGFCASLYWATNHLLIRVGIPVACMILFVLHPIAGNVWFYSLYWLIPILIHYNSRKSLFLHALASTFIAHAVGSVIWCYTMPMTETMWLALLPIVIVERILFALGMVIAHYMLTFIFEKIDYASATTISRTHYSSLGSSYGK